MLSYEVILKNETKEHTTSRFMSLSLAIHLMAILSVALMKSPISNSLKNTIQFEIQESNLSPQAKTESLPNEVTEKTPQKVKSIHLTEASNANSTLDEDLENIGSSNHANPAVEDLSNIQPEPLNINSKITSHGKISDVVDDDLISDLDKVTSKHQQEIATFKNGLDSNLSNESAELGKQIAHLKNSARPTKNPNYRASGLVNNGTSTDGINKTSPSEPKNIISGQEKISGLGQSHNQPRGINSLKQLPNNPNPKYSSDERLKGQQGTIVFVAFVTKEGALKNFKLIKSTGFRNLDAKTLIALKDWRFYPGQEGWVEIPMKWDLKGGAQEMPTLLRRISKN